MHGEARPIATERLGGRAVEKRRKFWILKVLIVIAGVVVLYFAYQTAHTGEAALARMSAEERELAQKLRALDSSSTLDDIVAVLGPPRRSEPRQRPTWRGPSGRDRIAVYLTTDSGSVRKIRWIKIGSYFWEHDPN
jgi:hypothetical protein